VKIRDVNEVTGDGLFKKEQTNLAPLGEILPRCRAERLFGFWRLVDRL
jgi:hypothetical protein